MVGAVVVALGVGGFVLLLGNSSTSRPSKPTFLTTHTILMATVVKGERRLQLVDTDHPQGEATYLQTAKNPLAATISPDRRSIVYTTLSGGERVPRIASVDGTSDRPLLDAAVGCTSASLAAWRPDGQQLAVICDNARLVVVDPHGKLVTTAPTSGYLSGVPTWLPYNGKELVVYERRDATGAPSQLRAVDPYTGREPFGDTSTPTSDTHPDYAAGAGLLYLSSTDPTAETGDVEVVKIDRQGVQTPKPVPGLENVDYATWSPDGTHIAFVSDHRLWTATPAGASTQQGLAKLTVQTEPAWGTR